MELPESQNSRDARIEKLWKKLDPQGKGELDLNGLKKGLTRIDHRESASSICCKLPPSNQACSFEKCKRHAQGCYQSDGQERRRSDTV